ncbi:MAG: hypothetical protein EXS10_07235 [Phycisphaerales bacterium]|nr:hypothetical protein [Phycisphaerales bacterium]
MRFTAHSIFAAATIIVASLSGCGTGVRTDPAKATRPYPFELAQGSVLEVQVLNVDEYMVIVNATLHEFTEVDVWLNQRYLQHVARIGPGETLQLEVAEFWDHRGEAPFPGGIFRRFQPTPIRLVQIQTAAKDPLIGLVAIPTERELERARLATGN